MEEIGTLSILLTDSNNIKLYNIALAPSYNSNLISFGHLQKSEIIYHNNLAIMILMRNKEIIAYIRGNITSLSLTLYN